MLGFLKRKDVPSKSDIKKESARAAFFVAWVIENLPRLAGSEIDEISLPYDMVEIVEEFLSFHDDKNFSVIRSIGGDFPYGHPGIVYFTREDFNQASLHIKEVVDNHERKIFGY